jgi:hypothetical protein
MGIDNVALETILLSQKYIKNNKTNACCLARQQFHISKNNINFFLSKYELYHLLDKYNNNEYFERFFKDLGFENIDSIDNSTSTTLAAISTGPLKDNIKNLMALCRNCHIEYGDKKDKIEYLENIHNEKLRNG